MEEKDIKTAIIDLSLSTVNFKIEPIDYEKPCKKVILFGTNYDLLDEINTKNNVKVKINNNISHLNLKLACIPKQLRLQTLKIFSKKYPIPFTEIKILRETFLGDRTELPYELEENLFGKLPEGNPNGYFYKQFECPVDANTRFEIEFNEDLKEEIKIIFLISRESDLPSGKPLVYLEKINNNTLNEGLLDVKKASDKSNPDKITLLQRIKKLFKKEN